MNPRIPVNCIFLIALLALLTGGISRAGIDTNRNGISDLWERRFFPSLLPSDVDLAADDDGDGWALLQEAAAGTSPFDATRPAGYLVPSLSLSAATPEQPGRVTLAWPSMPGKLYGILASGDLSEASWSLVGEVLGDGGPAEQSLDYPDPYSERPERRFFRLLIGDTDSDQDLLTDAEEAELGTDPFKAYTDDDYLSDYDEVVTYHTNPLAGDTDGNSLQDDQEPELATTVFQAGAFYAPELDWVSLWRAISYSYAEETGTPDPQHRFGQIYSTCSWNIMADQLTETNHRIDIGSLPAKLDSDIGFPSVDKLPPRWSFFSGVESFYGIHDHSETAFHSEARFILKGNRPSSVPITRNLMIIQYSNPADKPKVLTGVTALPFTIEAKMFHSAADILGEETMAAFKLIRTVNFRPADTEMTGWDATGDLSWRSLHVGGTVDGVVEFGGGEIPREVADLLEIAPAPGHEYMISISNPEFAVRSAQFKIHGLVESNDKGAIVQLRLKSEPAMVFAEMQVQVLPSISVPVLIYRIWDSRIPATEITRGLTDGQIIETLNRIFGPQANVLFTRDPESGTRDLRKMHRDPDGPDQPLIFGEDGTLNPHDHLDAIYNRTGNPNKVAVHVIEKYSFQNSAGSSRASWKMSFVSSSAIDLVYAHEVGHVLHAYLPPGGPLAPDHHDYGPWPWEWFSQQRVGLMFPVVDATISTTWLRRISWWNVNQRAQKLTQ